MITQFLYPGSIFYIKLFPAIRTNWWAYIVESLPPIRKMNRSPSKACMSITLVFQIVLQAAKNTTGNSKCILQALDIIFLLVTEKQPAKPGCCISATLKTVKDLPWLTTCRLTFISLYLILGGCNLLCDHLLALLCFPLVTDKKQHY